MASVDALPQPKEQPFGNSIRGDVSKYRFDGGHAAPALPGKHLRRIISHDFAAQKSQQNDVSLDKQMEKPHGQRWNASYDWQEHHKQQRMQQEHEEENKQLKHISETLAGILRQLPEYQTSEANPLRPKTPTGADLADADPAADSSLLAKFSKTTSFIERSHNLKDNLETGSLAPTDKDGEAAAADAAAADAAADAAAAERERQQQLMQQLAEHVIKEYPHGVPKRLQHELRSRGIVLPSLGFGETQSAPGFDAAFSTR